MPKRTATGYLIYNWKDNKIERVNKTKSGQIKPYETQVEVAITANVPEVNIPKVEMELDVGEPEIREVLGSELVETPAARLSEMPNPRRTIFALDTENYRERIGDWLDSELEDYDDPDRLDKVIDWWRSVCHAEHQEMNRPEILEFMESVLQDLKERQNNVRD